VLAAPQLRPLPDRALEVEQVIEEHDSAAVEAKLAFAQEQAIAAETPALGDDHTLGAAFGNVELGSDGVGLVQDARCGAGRHANQFA